MIGQSRCQQPGITYASVGKMMEIQSRDHETTAASKEITWQELNETARGLLYKMICNNNLRKLEFRVRTFSEIRRKFSY